MRFIFLFCLFVFSSLPLFAQMTEEQEEINNERRSLNYVRATHANLSQILWKFHVFDVNDDNILSDYMKTRNCLLYSKYYGDEFVWKNILEGIKREINYYAPEYPERFEILTLIPLGRYDFGELAFEISEGFKLENQGAISFPFLNYRDSGCDISYTSETFPEKIRFIPDNKYSITHVPVFPEQADALVDRLSRFGYQGFMSSNRVLTAAIKIKISTIESMSLHEGIIFRGQLDEIAFYEDPKRTRLVWKKSFKDLD